MAKLHIIWDLDGTLINSEQEVLEALIKSVKETGLTEKDQVKPFRVGPTIDKILDETFSPAVLTEDIKAEIIKKFRNNYDNCGFNNTPAFDGISNIIKNTDYVHYIVTNKPDLATLRIIKKLEWERYFKKIITPYSYLKSPSDKRLTKKELFSICINECKDQKFVGIGDMATDAIAAVSNEIPAIGVLWGTGTEQELSVSGCTYICKDTEELKKILEGIL